MKRTLSLKRETLAPLTNDEMASLAGAASLQECIALATLNTICVSLLQPCPTGYNCGQTWDSECSCRI
jgi:hypothetical protein